jgi:phosphoribosylaminoimidazole-succinocarboxamide synthase
MQALLYTDLPGVPLLNRGKVRDIYDLGDRLLIVASDRISAFDVVMPNGIPDKGKILTGLSLFWFDLLARIAPNHLLETDVARYPDPLPRFADQLAGRSMVVTKARVMPIECVVRGYLAGGGWKEYQQSGAICGIGLPPGLAESAQLPEPIFTPSTKASSGHDINITPAQAADMVGDEVFHGLRDRSLAIYRAAADYAREHGIIIADTKFEFGQRLGAASSQAGVGAAQSGDRAQESGDGVPELLLIDEVLTPDSSRFWDAAIYRPGASQDSFDKQYVRDYLETLDWNKEPPAPELPPDVVARTREKYLEAYRRLVGKELNLK